MIGANWRGMQILGFKRKKVLCDETQTQNPSVSLFAIETSLPHIMGIEGETVKRNRQPPQNIDKENFFVGIDKKKLAIQLQAKF